jgi:hypothetical protein
MAFIEKKDPVVLNIKLTSKGRELLSTGKLNFKYFAIGDSEIDYDFIGAVNAIDSNYTAFNSSIMRPVDNNPSIISFIPQNLSGDPYNVISSIPTTWYPVTNSVEPIGFFVNSTGNTFTFIKDTNHVKQPDAMIYMSGVTGGTKLTLKKGPEYGTSGEEPAVGDLVLVKWTLNADATGFTTQKNIPTPFLIYQIVSISGGSLGGGSVDVIVDRNIPDFSSYSPTVKAGAMIYYNQITFSGASILNQFSTDYLDESVLSFLENSQCPTVIFPFWNMSIIFTEEIAGVMSGTTNRKYTQFNSRTYGGFVSYIQSQQPYYKKLGVIHYTNQSPANVYAEGFYQSTPKLEIPLIMWHKSSGKTLGVTLTAGNDYTLVDLGIHYYELVDENNNVVGKIFDELKMFLIEDQEMLNAMSYKSNRSWTLPDFGLTAGGGCIEAPPAPPTLFVQTILGQAGSIKNTGGRNIIGWEKVTEYGVQYKLASDPDVPENWLRVSGTTALTGDSFTMDINETLYSATYNYRAYVRIGNNEFVDKANTYVITTLPEPVIPPKPPVIIPSVKTMEGDAGIGRIEDTGGNSIPTNVSVAIEKYGMMYKQTSLADLPANWTKFPVAGLSGPILGTSWDATITGLLPNTSYQYKAYIQVAGVEYPDSTIPYREITTLAQPVPTVYVPQVALGFPFKQLALTSGLIDLIVRDNMITDKGGAAVTEYGLIYTQDVTKNNATALQYGKTGILKNSVIGDYAEDTAFTLSATGLIPSTGIYVRAFAQNSAGIGYSEIFAGTTIAGGVMPSETATVFLTNITETSTTPTTISKITAKIGVSRPLSGNEQIILHFNNGAVSDTVTPPNTALSAAIRSCAYYTLGSSTTKNLLAQSSVAMGVQTNSSQNINGTYTITASNINNVCLHAEAYSATKNEGDSYTNCAAITLSSIDNVNGANYAVGSSNKIVAANGSTPVIRTRDLPTLDRDLL